MRLEEILITTLDRLRDKIENTIEGGKFWWGVGLSMLVVGSIILLIMIISIVANASYRVDTSMVFGLIVGVIAEILIGGGIDKMVGAGSSNDFLEGIKKEMEELRNTIVISMRREQS